MTVTSAMILRLALALLLGLPAAAEEAALAAAFAADDECDAGADPAACGLNALQVRASKTVEEAQAGEKLSAVGWYLGRQDASCTATCTAKRMSCSAADFRTVTGWQTLFGIAQQAGSQCKYSWANDNKHGPGFNQVPAVCTLSRCGSDMQGTCAYDTSPKATCDGAPATGFSRLCPCVSSSSVFPAPGPTPDFSSPAPAPGPRPNYNCKADTGGSCKVFGCASSRGKTTCDKKAGYKCLCQTGYCADAKGACVKNR